MIYEQQNGDASVYGAGVRSFKSVIALFARGCGAFPTGGVWW